jgi:hypothetical protein
VVGSHHARVFAPVLSNRIREQTLTLEIFMKPTSQISPGKHAPRSFPLTDYSFQATVDTRTSSSAISPEKKLRAFRKLSSEFFGAETSRDYMAELLFFTLLAGVSAWPIISAIVAVTRLVRNY